MKKKFRDIEVDGVQYAWAVQEMDWPKAELKIWEKRRGKVAWCQLEFQLAKRVITPSNVRALILKLLKNKKAKAYLKETRGTFMSNLSEFSEN